MSGRQENMVPIGGYAEAPFVAPEVCRGGPRAGSARVETPASQGEVAVAIAGAESPSETQTLGSYSDWRLIKL